MCDSSECEYEPDPRYEVKGMTFKDWRRAYEGEEREAEKKVGGVH